MADKDRVPKHANKRHLQSLDVITFKTILGTASNTVDLFLTGAFYQKFITTNIIEQLPSVRFTHFSNFMWNRYCNSLGKCAAIYHWIWGIEYSCDVPSFESQHCHRAPASNECNEEYQTHHISTGSLFNYWGGAKFSINSLQFKVL